jgi:hypothetical protein
MVVAHGDLRCAHFTEFPVCIATTRRESNNSGARGPSAKRNMPSTGCLRGTQLCQIRALTRRDRADGWRAQSACQWPSRWIR